MQHASVETPDGDDVEIDPEEVIELAADEEDGTTLIELEDGTEVIVVATQIEVAAQLRLDPLEYIDPDDDDPTDVEAEKEDEW